MAELAERGRDRDFAESWDEWRQLVDRKFDLAEGMKKGIRKGRREGIRKGREEGRVEGMEKGMEEGARKTALAMLMEGLPLSLIARCTGLTIDEISRLENQLRKA
ncbi:MAG: hypothetical protein LBU15_03290 [Rickettsiales bacterium]|jgi:predicted transposase/invertase (TIGR01784 family)|nr:hypothetical protein [Rickettsiales bacterium]